MTRLLPAFFACLLLFQIAGAQTGELEEARELNRKVIQLYQEKKFGEALPLAKRVLELREKALGKEHQLVVEALINLAELHLATQSYREALPFYERVLKSNEKQAGAEDASTALLLDKVAFLRFVTGDNKGAENFYRRSLVINEKIYAPDSNEVAQAVYNLAEFYRQTYSFQKSAPLFQRALPLLEKSYGAESAKMIGVLENYACLLGRLDKERESESFWKRAGDIRTRVINESLKAKGAQPVQGEKFNRSQPISKPQPVYPEEARRQRLIGTAVVHVAIDGTGRVIRACGRGADPILLRAAEQAALRARFSPLILEGIPVETTSVIIYGFTIR